MGSSDFKGANSFGSGQPGALQPSTSSATDNLKEKLRIKNNDYDMSEILSVFQME